MRQILVILSFFQVFFLICSSYALPSCAEREKIWSTYHKRDFEIISNSKDNRFICPGSDANLALSLMDLYDLKLTPNKAGYSPKFYRMVKSSVRTFELSRTCKDEVIALSFVDEKKVQICQHFHKDTREGRAATLIHESRHLQPDDPSHVACSKGPFKEDPKTVLASCDQKFFDGSLNGSGYNADVYFFGWALADPSKNTLSSALLKAEIRGTVPDRFNQITPEQTKEWRK